MIDADDAWIQDAIDALAEDMMSDYNRDRVVVYNTVQMYRHDRLAYLEAMADRAAEGGYLAGVKLVRGAYMEKEQACCPTRLPLPDSTRQSQLRPRLRRSRALGVGPHRPHPPCGRQPQRGKQPQALRMDGRSWVGARRRAGGICPAFGHERPHHVQPRRAWVQRSQIRALRPHP